MTTVEYGGGPTIEQRRSFSGLKEGAHIPGYQGYCPQLKYSIGKTFGRETGELSQIRRCRRHQMQQPDETQGATESRFTEKLPESDGENKYTENMTPGYTGYIPRWPFKFGKSYKEECDICLSEFFAAREQLLKMEQEVNSMSRSLPSLRAVSTDPEVRDHLNALHTRGSIMSPDLSKRRETLEPPMPGYRGFIPRIHTTELGLGCRYTEMTRNGLENFYTARAERLQKIGPLYDTFGAQRLEPVSMRRSQSATIDVKTGGPRVYLQDGMIPKYTGYVPQQRYAVGNTYGDETRSLEVCAHDQRCYGDYVKQHLA